MMTRLSSYLFVWALLVVAELMICAAHADKPEAHRLEQVRKDLESKLDGNAAMEFEEIPLDEVLAVLSDEHHLPLSVDAASLDDLGLAASDPITVYVNDLPLRFALQHALRPLDLVFAIRDEGVVVMSRETAEAQTRPVVYPISDLVTGTRRETASERLDRLAELITSVVQPESWDEVGGNGTLSFLETCGSMVISQTDSVHRGVAGVLDGLRRLAKQRPSADELSVKPLRMSLDDGWRDSIHAKLDQLASVDLYELPLDEVVVVLQDEHDLPVLIDSQSLDDLGLTTSDPFSIRAQGISLRSVLRRMLRPLDLTFVLQDGVVIIASVERAESTLIPVAFPVGHLLRPRERADKSSNHGAASAASDEPLDFDTLIELITSTIEASSWEEVGGPGVLVPWDDPPCLVCAQTGENQAKIQRLLVRLAQVRVQSPMARESTAVASAMALEAYPLRIDPDTGNEVLQLLMELVPEARPNDAGAVIRLVGQQLIVKNRRSVQREIHATLRSLNFLPPDAMGGGFGGGGGMFGVQPAGRAPAAPTR